MFRLNQKRIINLLYNNYQIQKKGEILTKPTKM